MFAKDEIGYIFVMSEDFNAASLVEISRLDQPDVLLAVLVWNALVPRPASCDFTEAMHEFFDAGVVVVSSDDEGSWG